jgi:hypothetical protein
VCCSYSVNVIITMLKSVARIRLVKAGEDLACSDLQSVEVSDVVILTCSYDL